MCVKRVGVVVVPSRRSGGSGGSSRPDGRQHSSSPQLLPSHHEEGDSLLQMRPLALHWLALLVAVQGTTLVDNLGNHMFHIYMNDGVEDMVFTPLVDAHTATVILAHGLGDSGATLLSCHECTFCTGMTAVACVYMYVFVGMKPVRYSPRLGAQRAAHTGYATAVGEVHFADGSRRAGHTQWRSGNALMGTYLTIPIVRIPAEVLHVRSTRRSQSH